MKVNIDFSLFSSPTDAYGNVTGVIELPAVPKIGDEISLSTHRFHVKRVKPLEWEGNKTVIIGLDDVVLNSISEAQNFAARLKRELGLTCDEYDRG